MKQTIRLIAAALACISAFTFISCDKEDIKDNKENKEEQPVDKTVAVTGITLDKTTLTLTEGDQATLTATVAPENASDKSISWKSSDEKVATVTDGVVKALSGGTATITVTAKDGSGVSASCALTVNSILEFALAATQLAPLNEPRITPVLILNGADDYVVVGGHTTGFSRSKTAERYSNGAWTTIQENIYFDISAQVTLKDGRTLVAGGMRSGGGVGQIKSAAIYDPAANTFTSVSDMNVARGMERGALLKDGKVLIAGNWYNDGGQIEIFDPETSVFTLVGQYLDFETSAPFIFPTDDGGAVIVSQYDIHGSKFGEPHVTKYNPGGGDNTLVSKDGLLDGYVVLTGMSAGTDITEWYREADGNYYFVAMKENTNFLMAFDPAGETFREIAELPSTYNEIPYYAYCGAAIIDNVHDVLYLTAIQQDGPLYINAFKPDTGEILYAAQYPYSVVGSMGLRVLPDGDLLSVGGTVNGSNYNASAEVYRIHFVD
ncbi:MAG: Ig-like domain-containing protein [Bacteroidales bacterium]|nr:Ig-like domain-containing protein [Bacteroidales bacterium]